MLKHRLITAIILVSILFGIIFFLSTKIFYYFSIAVVLLAGWEWAGLMKNPTIITKILFLSLLFFSWFSIMFASFVGLNLFWTMLFSTAFWCFAAYSLGYYHYRRKMLFESNLAMGVAGVFVLLPTWIALNFIRSDHDGLYILTYLFLLICLADTSAYFAGRKWGTTKLAPTISPNKSIEGVIAAGASTILLCLITLYIFPLTLKMAIGAIVLSLMVMLFSVIGDLFESMLKHAANVKDSGKMLPGHGGVLDRIDSLTAAAPIYLFGAMILDKFLNS